MKATSGEVALIITSTVYPRADLTTITDPHIREAQYLESLDFWLAMPAIRKIIICDNSGYTYSATYLARAAARQKELEILSFTGDSQKVLQQGKGYGEGEILEYISRHSTLFKQVSGFFKITGRLTVSNFEKIISRINPAHNYFSTAIPKPRFLCRPEELVYKRRIDTRFYYTGKNFFLTHLLSCYHLVNDPQETYLEDVYFQVLHNIRTSLLLPLPIIQGYSGSTGKPYHQLSPFRHKVYGLLARLR